MHDAGANHMLPFFCFTHDGEILFWMVSRKIRDPIKLGLPPQFPNFPTSGDPLYGIGMEKLSVFTVVSAEPRIVSFFLNTEWSHLEVKITENYSIQSFLLFCNSNCH